MLYHHDSTRTYNEAASDAAARAKLKMLDTIDRGRSSAKTTIEHVFANAPTDALIRNRAFEFEVEGGQVLMGAKGWERSPLTKHSLGQICTKAGMPPGYARELLESKNARIAGLVRDNLRTLFVEGDDERSLVRCAEGQVRAVLSDSYKRLDSRPLIEAFVQMADKAGLVPIQGFATETKVSLKALLPVVFEPAANEVICFGLHWENSDYGAGAHTVQIFMLRLWCTNFAIAERALRQVHLGKKLDDISFSERTHKLDAQTQASALKDIVGKALSADRVEAYCGAIAAAAAESIDPNRALDQLVKTGALLKGERKEIGAKFVSADVEMLPPGNTIWRLSNAISWFAHSGGADADRRMELERVAGHVLPVVAKAA